MHILVGRLKRKECIFLCDGGSKELQHTIVEANGQSEEDNEGEYSKV